MRNAKTLAALVVAGLLAAGTGCVVKTTQTRETAVSRESSDEAGAPAEKRTEVEVKPAWPRFDG